MKKKLIAAGLAVAAAGSSLTAVPTHAAEIVVRKKGFVPYKVELHLTHGEVQDIRNGKSLPLPAPWSEIVKTVADVLGEADKNGNGAKVCMLPLMAAPIWVESR